MQLLTPAWLFLGALAIPIILLYMLKLRRKQVQVSSTFLWEQLLREQQANAPWQKLKRNLLLILQLLILAAIIFALARPALQVPTVTTGSVIVLLDASASMNATDGEPTRFDSAKKSAQVIIDGLNPASSMTLILVGKTPEILASAETDKTKIKSALSQAQPTSSSANWEAAFALAAGASRGNQVKATTIIISDGGLPEKGLPALSGDVQYLPIGTSSDNLSISALALRPTDKGPDLFAQVHNYSDIDRTILISFYFGTDLFDARQLKIAAGKNESITLENLQNTAGIYKAIITSADGKALDKLPIDDTAYAVYQSSAERRVLLVSKGNLYLEQALASLPNIQAFRALPAAGGSLQIPKEPFDLYVFDGITPTELPNGNLLLINPSSNSLFQVGADVENIKDMQVVENNLTRYLDWSNVHILKARQVQLPEWADSLIESPQGPLVFAGETGQQHIAALTFDLRESDLPLQIAFPILFSNLTNYLVPPSAFDSTQSLRPGESLHILPPPGTEQVLIATPSNLGFTFKPEVGGVNFTSTNELGYYAVNFLSKNTNSFAYFAVNLFDENESNIAPQQNLQIGRDTVTPTLSKKIGLRELWPWLALLALIILLIEWQVYHRKQFAVKRTVKS
ncbi:MAG: BatA and WFA domain-containing protein [Anaerolineales bacterium]